MNHQEITGNNRTITGNHNTITGDENNIVGNHNIICGTKNLIKGNHNVIIGSENCIVGNHNRGDGKNNILQGNYNKQENVENTTAKRKRSIESIGTTVGQSVVTAYGIITVEGISATIKNDIVSIRDTNISLTYDGKAKIVNKYGMCCYCTKRATFNDFEIQVSDRKLTIKPHDNQNSTNSFTINHGNKTITNDRFPIVTSQIPSSNQYGLGSSFTIGTIQNVVNLGERVQRIIDNHPELAVIDTPSTNVIDLDELELEKTIELSKQKKEQLKIPKEEVELVADTDNQDELCSICFERKKCCTIVDCGHSGLCVTCSRKIVLSDKKECPFCRSKIEEGIIRTYK